KRYPLGPLENEVILVQSNGIAQWLKLALAADPEPGEGGGCGIAAALDISLPSRFLWRAYRAVLGHAAAPEISPFDKSRLIWRLMRLLPERLAAPEYAPLCRFLEDDTDLRKRFQLAERLADLFDQYQVYRADWLEAWQNGEDILIKAHGDSLPLPEEQRWQPSLWRSLLADVAGMESPSDPNAHNGRAAVHEAFLARASAWPEAAPPPTGLPRRLMVFGISSLPRQSLEVLAMLGRWVQVLMCVPNPCEHFWADIVADRELLRADYRRQRRRGGSPREIAEEALHLHAHPLLAAWGKQGRDFIALLDEHDSDEAQSRYRPYFEAIGHQRIDLYSPPDTGTLLGQLQDDIRDLRPLRESRALWPPVDPDRDGSIRFHSAHSPQREVEILQDRLLAAFNADPSLRPRDVIVMVPEIDVYAPSIQAVFGRLEWDDPRYLPFTVADQLQRRVDPLLRGLESLLALPQSRLAVSDVLDWLEVPAIRQRFGFAESDLPTLHRWIRGANIRWGLHDAHRVSLGLPVWSEGAAAAGQVVPHTWLFGLRRMLLGYAVGDADAWRDIEPYTEIGGLDAALLGPLTRFLEQLESVWQDLSTPATVAEWCVSLRALLGDFFEAGDTRDAYTLLRLDEALSEWQEACEAAGLTEALPLSVVGPYWLSRLDDGGLSQRFMAGAITFATLMPMRAIPFRRVCLLGMNDGDYPRSRAPLDFDLMGQDYRPGDRSRREDDRYLFLEALLSAREHLHISWVGRRITDNAERPPSVLVAQLRDHLGLGWTLAGHPGPAESAGRELVRALSVEHPLQAFSRAYFPADSTVSPLFTYAHEWQPDARPPAGAALSLLAPHGRDEPLTVAELAGFLKNPVRQFFRERLKVSFDIEDPASADQEPFSLDALENWQLQDELIQAQVHAVSRDQPPDVALAAQLARMARRGDLAPGGFGAVQAEQLAEPMPALIEAYQAALSRWPRPMEEEALRHVHPIAGQALEIADWLGGVRANEAGERGRVVIESSNLVDGNNRYRHDRLIRHWVRHVAQHLAGEPLITLVLSKKGQVELGPLTRAQAETWMNEWLEAWSEGMRRPLPLAVKSAFAWLRTGDPDEARHTYEGGPFQVGEVDSDPCLGRAYPDFGTLAENDEFYALAGRLLRPLGDAIPAKAGGRA
ncbi:MAG: exodeoxyribonuclease V subunit gamma, partial [Methylococcus sp.]